MNARLLRSYLLFSLVLVLAFAKAAVGQQPGIRASLLTASERKPAPAFALQDASGKTARLEDYHDKVLLLDFWATWCTGCKKEIPWFTRFQETYGLSKFVAVGVSMDDGGWKVLKPFLNQHPIPYQVVLADKATAERYEINSMPDTFLIDQHGRIAAAYRAGLVDKENVEANITTLLAEH